MNSICQCRRRRIPFSHARTTIKGTAGSNATTASSTRPVRVLDFERALTHLPQDEQAILLLVYREGQRQDDTARAHPLLHAQSRLPVAPIAQACSQRPRPPRPAVTRLATSAKICPNPGPYH